MSIFIVRLGTLRKPDEGVWLGTMRRPPRGVPKSDFAQLDFYGVWFPNLSPIAELVKEALGAADERAWAAFSRKFRREMSAPDRSRELDLRAGAVAPIGRSAARMRVAATGSLLRELLLKRDADVV